MDYKSIAAVYADCFDKFGATNKGIDWPDQREVNKRYEAALAIVPVSVGTLLDVGCGYGGFFEYLSNSNIPVHYTGLDINENYIKYCKKKYYGVKFIVRDILEEGLNFRSDYVILNGVLTAKYDLSHDHMLEFSRKLVTACFEQCDYGLAVNFTSPCAEAKEKLFRPSFDEVGDLASELTSKFVIDHSYLPFEQMLYLYR